MPRPLYLRGEYPWYALDRRLGYVQSVVTKITSLYSVTVLGKLQQNVQSLTSAEHLLYMDLL